MVSRPSQAIRLTAAAMDAGNDREFDLDTILHPGRVFASPVDVVRDPRLSLREKRAILASWASDACAVEAAPTLRRAPGADKPVAFDEVMDALRILDAPSGAAADGPQARDRRRSAARRRMWPRFRRFPSGTNSLN